MPPVYAHLPYPGTGSLPLGLPPGQAHVQSGGGRAAIHTEGAGRDAPDTGLCG